MKKILLMTLPLIFIAALAYATLTATTVPVTKTGGSSPVLQNGSITDLGTASGPGNVGIGSAFPQATLDVEGTGINYFPTNVGIANNNPGQALDVTGTVRATQFVGGGVGLTGVIASAAAAGSTNAVQYNSGSSTLGGTASIFSFNGINIGIGTSAGNNLLDVRGSSITNSFQVTPGGNIGIGSTNPREALDIVGNIGIENASVMEFLHVDAAGINYIDGGITGTHDIVLNSAGSANVGIGTTAPGAALGVFGSPFANEIIKNTGSGGSSWTVGVSNTASTIGANYLFFVPNSVSTGSSKLVLSTAGNMGVGSVNPGTALDVTGTIRASSIYAVGTNNGVTGSGGTSCLCKTFTGGICTVIGTCT